MAFYVTLFSTLEQTHCAHMWFYSSFYSAFLKSHWSGECIQGWCVQLTLPFSEMQMGRWSCCRRSMWTAAWVWSAWCPSFSAKRPTMTQTSLCLSLRPFSRYGFPAVVWMCLLHELLHCVTCHWLLRNLVSKTFQIWCDSGLHWTSHFVTAVLLMCIPCHGYTGTWNLCFAFVW